MVVVAVVCIGSVLSTGIVVVVDSCDCASGVIGASGLEANGKNIIIAKANTFMTKVAT